jgi:hypothetical protein
MHSERSCSSHNLSSTQSLWPDLGLNTGHRGGMLGTNCLSYGIASMWRWYCVNFCIITHLGTQQRLLENAVYSGCFSKTRAQVHGWMFLAASLMSVSLSHKTHFISLKVQATSSLVSHSQLKMSSRLSGTSPESSSLCNSTCTWPHGVRLGPPSSSHLWRLILCLILWCSTVLDGAGPFVFYYDPPHWKASQISSPRISNKIQINRRGVSTLVPVPSVPWRRMYVVEPATQL